MKYEYPEHMKINPKEARAINKRLKIILKYFVYGLLVGIAQILLILFIYLTRRYL